MRKILFFLCFLFFTLKAREIELIKGQVVFLEFDKNNFLQISSNSKKLPFFEYKNKIIVSIAMPYKNPKDRKLIVEFKDNSKEEINIKFNEGNYKKEFLKVSASKVNPPKETLDRISKEYKEAIKVYNTYTNMAFFEGNFTYPLESKITSDFGKARLFNDTLKSYHSGTDFRAASGTKIYASNDGIVRIASNRYYAGNSVVIDHGYGIYSQYYHLSKLNVKIGQKVKKGELIGLSGASGRVTGPHLHFGILVNGVQVDPLDFIAKFNAL
ncbi:M23 family metallopeptidase [Campylobacter lari]|uniref:M23 family metallopeptidase n=2 Tax=Campylobacter lari TaxID=201 RepID=A0A7U7XB63_CAMLA|nr:M23 family metallopeptidase [Campylobacter lari]EAI1583104.1 M23 family metallopeptidase [Campylobacter lari]EAI3912686.1 M23 family metallopeptidase [Campylobacter lari]EAI4828465.1 M23 family metallopeptidase [Campylobacter lari]EAI7269611.1 M23 family metallopeptidase [Campylobacter lari]EAJ0325209.1 M23 family metallopeptidase [Campylobacter lari]